MSGLTAKQQLFIDHYLQCWNATEAARQAQYQGNDITLAAVGYENLRKPHVASAIKQRLQESAMSANEALSRLAAMARGNMGDYIQSAGIFDWEKVKEDGHLFKSVTHTVGKQSQIVMHDPQAALVQILKAHGAFVQKVEHTGKDGGPIQVKGKITIRVYDDD